MLSGNRSHTTLEQTMYTDAAPPSEYTSQESACGMQYWLHSEGLASHPTDMLDAMPKSTVVDSGQLMRAVQGSGDVSHDVDVAESAV